MRDALLQLNGHAQSVRVWCCETWLERAMGFIGQAPLPPAEILLLTGCSAIHSFGLRQRVDIAFTDARGQVLRCVRGLSRRRFAICRGAQAAWVMRAGLLPLLGIENGSDLGLLGRVRHERQLLAAQRVGVGHGRLRHR